MQTMAGGFLGAARAPPYHRRWTALPRRRQLQVPAPAPLCIQRRHVINWLVRRLILIESRGECLNAYYQMRSSWWAAAANHVGCNGFL